MLACRQVAQGPRKAVDLGRVGAELKNGNALAGGMKMDI